MTCGKCGTPIKPGQLYIRGKAEHARWPVRLRPTHVACPNEREIAHAKRMGRL